MKLTPTALKIAIVLLLSYSVSYAINYFVFDDKTFISLPKALTWLFLAAFITYLFIRGDLKSKDESK